MFLGLDNPRDRGYHEGMIELLEHLIKQSARFPRHPRKALYRELLRSETFLLTVGVPIDRDRIMRLGGANDTFSVWADRDAELGGVWVPIFPARDSVSDFVTSGGLKAPAGQELLWMEHEPGQAFTLLRSVECFAGVRLYLDRAHQLALSWSQVKSLSQGLMPTDTPEIYELPLERLDLPEGLRLAFGRVDAGGSEGKLLCLPEAGHFRIEDTAKLVRVDLAAQGSVLVACRHFLQILRYLRGRTHGDAGRYVEDLLRSLETFQMYGEAESLCEWLATKGNEAYAWIHLAAIYGKEGKLNQCAILCRRGRAKYPEQKSFPINEARALVALHRENEAKGVVETALERFPNEPALLKLESQL